jgi:lipopolysaccharide/colanic/teichoic acid biosynthesis glycosyltransferase
VASQYCEQGSKPLHYRIVKRAFDIAFSAVVIVVGLVPSLILGVFIVIDTKGSPIYSQERVGRSGKTFRILKFRTMVADSDDAEKYFTPQQLETWKRERKVDDDPRITRLGGLLRKVSLDELPQFVNVLMGQISIIGPRVITADELEQFGDAKADLLSVPPGITGLWQVGDRNAATFENGRRQAIELDYVKRASLGLDVQIFLKTFGAMFVKRSGQ